MKNNPFSLIRIPDKYHKKGTLLSNFPTHEDMACLTFMRTLLGEMELPLSCRWRRWRSEKLSSLSGVTQIFNELSSDLKNFNCHPSSQPITKTTLLMNRFPISTETYWQKLEFWLQTTNSACSPFIFSKALASSHSMLPVSYDWNLKACNC